jgi:hypothetical protein
MPNNTQITPCCYNTSNPITAKISLSDSNLNNSLTQVVTYNSESDGFDTWVQLKATLPPSTTTNIFDVVLQIDTGLNCCCEYDVFVDRIGVLCTGTSESLLVNDIKCPGFDLTKVIDNKKSWVYNPGLPEVGISEYDVIERADGSFGLIAGEGTINRTFAPSPDAEIPWRYTNYWEQSSVYEKHSNLVLNSKELWLTFDMCADCPISGTTLACPSGYTLSANTVYCYSGSVTTSATTEINVTYLSLLNLEKYKKQVQSFWVPFMEQFTPATAIWVSGERWCNEPCSIINTCDFDLTESEVSVINVEEGGNKSLEANRSPISSNVPEVIVSVATLGNSTGFTGELPKTETKDIIPTKDLGFIIEKTNSLKPSDNDIDILSYRNKFTSVTLTVIENI